MTMNRNKILKESMGIANGQRKQWTVFIGYWDCQRREDCHSEKSFSTSRDCWAFMWAKANCKVPEKCWVFAGLDGWEFNGILAGKEFPKDMANLIGYYIKEEDDLEALARGVELPVEARKTPRGNVMLYCPAMRYERVVGESELQDDLDSLAEEYAGILEAEWGADEGSVRVTPVVTYGKPINLED